MTLIFNANLSLEVCAIVVSSPVSNANDSVKHIALFTLIDDQRAGTASGLHSAITSSCSVVEIFKQVKESIRCFAVSRRCFAQVSASSSTASYILPSDAMIVLAKVSMGRNHMT